MIMKKFKNFAVDFTKISKNRAKRNAEIKQKALERYKIDYMVSKTITLPLSLLKWQSSLRYTKKQSSLSESV